MTAFRRVESYRRQQGHKYVAGVDEVGRGAWAGPLVAAALILKPYSKLPNLKDSKQVTALQRKRWAVKIAASSIGYSWGIVTAREIDSIGIAKANNLAFQRAIDNLAPRPDYAFADYFSLDGCKCPIEGVKGGDVEVRTIAAASILAKVFRDNIMGMVGRIYPEYGFAEHKGYGAAAHKKAIKKYGFCPWHRRSFDI